MKRFSILALVLALAPRFVAAADVPNRDDIEALRQAIANIVPEGYRVGPYNDVLGVRGFVVSSGPISAGDQTMEGPAIEFVVYSFISKQEWRRLNSESQKALEEFRSLPVAERDKRRKELLLRIHDLPGAYFRSIGIGLVHRDAIIEKDETLRKRYEAEVRRLKEFESALLKVITLYD